MTRPSLFNCTHDASTRYYEKSGAPRCRTCQNNRRRALAARKRAGIPAVKPLRAPQFLALERAEQARAQA